MGGISSKKTKGGERASTQRTQTPEERLIQAIKEGKVEQVRQLLTENRSLLNVKDNEGNSLLHIATESTSAESLIDMIKALLELGVEPTIKKNGNVIPRTNNHDDTVLHVIAKRWDNFDLQESKMQVVQLFMQHVPPAYQRSFIEYQNSDRNMALHVLIDTWVGVPIEGLSPAVQEYLEGYALKPQSPEERRQFGTPKRRNRPNISPPMERTARSGNGLRF